MILSLNGIALISAILADTSALRSRIDTIAALPVVSADANTVIQDTIRLVTPPDSVNTGVVASLASLQTNDTIPRRRVSVEYSDAYGTRAMIHRRLSYAMLPLFALSYYTGDKLFQNGPNSSAAVRNLHRISATSVTALFAVNTVTGGINLWQGRHDPIERKRKLIHAALFVAASAGFSYAGAVLANEAETSLAKRKDHRNLTLVSMGFSVSSVLVMMVGRD